MSLGAYLQSRHSQDMSHSSRPGPKEETWTPKNTYVNSRTGRASISARRSTEGPGPFLSTATRPCPPIDVQSLYPALKDSRCELMVEAVSRSWRESSG